MGSRRQELLCTLARSAILGAVATGCVVATVGQWGIVPLAIGVGVVIGLALGGLGWWRAGREPTSAAAQRLSAWLGPNSGNLRCQASQRVVRTTTAYLNEMPRVAFRVAAGGMMGECALLTASAALYLLDLVDSSRA